MEKVGDCFVRLKDGEWFCRAPCEVEVPGTLASFTPGVVYRRGQPHMGIDVAAILDDWLVIGALPPYISFR